MNARFLGWMLGVGAWTVGALAFGLQATPLETQVTPAAARAQETISDPFEALDAFLPGDGNAKDEDAKVLLMINCTTCHGPNDTKNRIASRAGGDLAFWTTVVGRMSTSLSANIPEEDRHQIAAYLAKYFGPKRPAGGKVKKR